MSGTAPGIVTGQVKIVTTGTAVQLITGLGVTSCPLANGVVVKSVAANSANGGAVGGKGVTNVINGTGNGYILQPGEASSFAPTDLSYLWVNGNAGDIYTFEGN